LLSRGPRRRCPGLARTGHLEQASSIGPARTNRLFVRRGPDRLPWSGVDQAAQLVRGGWTNPLDQRRPGLARNGCPWTRHASTGQTPGQPTIEALVPSAYVTGPTSRTSHDPSWSKPIRDPWTSAGRWSNGPGPNSRTKGALVKRLVHERDGPRGWTKYGWSRNLVQPAKDQRSGGAVQECSWTKPKSRGPESGPVPWAKHRTKTSRAEASSAWRHLTSANSRRPMPRPSVARGPSRRPLCRSTRSTVPAREPRPRCGRAAHHDVDRTAGSGAQCNAACAHLRAPLAPPSLGARG
jgi:hypothetical protein